MELGVGPVGGLKIDLIVQVLDIVSFDLNSFRRMTQAPFWTFYLLIWTP